MSSDSSRGATGRTYGASNLAKALEAARRRSRTLEAVFMVKSI